MVAIKGLSLHDLQGWKDLEWLFLNLEIYLLALKIKPLFGIGNHFFLGGWGGRVSY